MIITSPILITMQPQRALINEGAVAFKGGTILAVGSAKKVTIKYNGHEVIRLENSVLLPGLINVHTHLELPPLLDAVRAAAFPEWVLHLIKKKKKLTARDYGKATRQNVDTLLRTGTTTVVEICTHNISPRLILQSGMRAMIFHEMISMHPSSPFPRLSAPSRQASGLVHSGLSPHAPYTVAEQLLLKIKNIALQKKMPLCMHVAESKDEVKLLRGKKSGFDKLYQAAGWDRSWAPSASSPFEYLYRLGLLSPRFLAVHAVQASNRDSRLMQRSKVPVAHCPRSNKETAVGRMPLKKFLEAGITVGLGTDSLASSPSLSMWDEMRYALQIHQRDGITARDIFEIATMGGAKALGMDKEIGSLEPGKKADIIAVPLPKKNTGDLYSDLLRETKSCIMTMVNGRILYRR